MKTALVKIVIHLPSCLYSNYNVTTYKVPRSLHYKIYTSFHNICVYQIAFKLWSCTNSAAGDGSIKVPSAPKQAQPIFYFSKHG